MGWSLLTTRAFWISCGKEKISWFMSFIADKQTLDDLNLLGKYKSNAIFGLFNKVYTEGGEKLLEQMFRQPLTDAQAINHRSMTIGGLEKRRRNSF